MPYVLSSWKEIAQFMGSSVRTVQRWEQQGRLSVHRPSPFVVLAFPLELKKYPVKRVETDQIRRLHAMRQTLAYNRERMDRNMKRLSALRAHFATRRERLQLLRDRLASLEPS